MIAEYVNGDLSIDYILGEVIDRPVAYVAWGSAFWYAANRLGTIAAITSEAGAVVERYRYDAHGTRTVLSPDGTVRPGTAVQNQIGFTGRYHDPLTGLVDFRFRQYSPTLGRFISRDDEYRSSMSLYRASFVPNFTDPSGHQPVDPADAADDPAEDEIGLTYEVGTEDNAQPVRFASGLFESFVQPGSLVQVAPIDLSRRRPLSDTVSRSISGNTQAVAMQQALFAQAPSIHCDTRVGSPKREDNGWFVSVTGQFQCSSDMFYLELVVEIFLNFGFEGRSPIARTNPLDRRSFRQLSARAARYCEDGAWVGEGDFLGIPPPGYKPRFSRKIVAGPGRSIQCERPVGTEGGRQPGEPTGSSPTGGTAPGQCTQQIGIGITGGCETGNTDLRGEELCDLEGFEIPCSALPGQGAAT